MKKLLAVLLITTFITGCQAGGNGQGKNIEKPMQMSNKAALNQHISEQADQALRNENNLTDVQAVNDDKQLLIAAQVPHNERFQMKKIEKKLTNQAKEQFSDYTITLSLDKKIHLEVMKLKKRIAEGKVDKKKLSMEIDSLIKLSKEKT
ncbi:YhcN/YlaJ family sporulation lipoprotein [Thalassobacillus devorans]|uniref:YhcN/YlaJ family sporulation lipoprotein n=1 Tax=Thalassobacillus devorans TaxID=279813 RepID=UPI00048B71AC|nr:YhcN/YlaJ family sporulation lipoprotein [Thalassobacillus devorans]